MRSISTVFFSLALLGAAQAPTTLTPADLQKSMQKIGPAYAALLKDVKGDLKAAATDADTLATEFGNVERFWAQRNRPDAVKWAQDARAAASTIAGAAAANDGAKAVTAAPLIGGQCKSCHSAYREGTQETGFKIKAGTI